MIETTIPGLRLRAFRRDDAEALVRLADDREVWRNLRDRFPHPYRPKDAAAFLDHACAGGVGWLYALDLDDALVGGVGLHAQDDVARRSLEIGYWLGRPYWGRGLATAAVRALSAQVFATRPEIERLFAGVFAWNPASGRVLEKSGFRLEGRLRRGVWKDGEFVDRLLYGRLRDEDDGASAGG